LTHPATCRLHQRYEIIDRARPVQPWLQRRYATHHDTGDIHPGRATLDWGPVKLRMTSVDAPKKADLPLLTRLGVIRPRAMASSVNRTSFQGRSCALLLRRCTRLAVVPVGRAMISPWQRDEDPTTRRPGGLEGHTFRIRARLPPGRVLLYRARGLRHRGNRRALPCMVL